MVEDLLDDLGFLNTGADTERSVEAFGVDAIHYQQMGMDISIKRTAKALGMRNSGIAIKLWEGNRGEGKE